MESLGQAVMMLCYIITCIVSNTTQHLSSTKEKCMCCTASVIGLLADKRLIRVIDYLAYAGGNSVPTILGSSII